MEPRHIQSKPIGIREPVDAADDELDLFDRGLACDLATLMSRRQVMKLIGYTGIGAGVLTIAACAPSVLSSGAATAGASATGTSGTAASAAASLAASPAATAVASANADLTKIPEETAGPYPGDGSNGPDILTLSGVVRSDIQSSFGSGSGIAAGVPLTIKLTLLDIANGGTPLMGAAVYLWHCNREGQYSLYSQGVTSENYLRGVQASGTDGVVSFTSIFPGCYSGRWPHVHFEVYPSLAKATDSANKIATSQLALPKDTCDLVYVTDGYSASVGNLARVSLQSDNVFGNDAGIRQIGTISGSVADGFSVELVVPV